MSLLLEAKNLRTHFYSEQGVVKAVDGVSFSISEGETVGIIGESGCGKTTLALSILGLVPSPRAEVVEGEVIFGGKNLLKETEANLRALRGNKIAMIFQDPFTSLNPAFTVGNQVAEAVRAHQPVSKAQAWREAIRLLELVEIPRSQERARDYPHQFSGGMRQRVMIAMALSCHPQLLIADEPTTALDVTTQAQILELIGKIQSETGSALLVITHDLGVIAEVAQRVLVIYAGRIVEQGLVDTIYYEAKHPYTKGLLGSVTSLSCSKEERLKPIKGSPPSLINLPAGCAFSPRCSYAEQVCFEKVPELTEVSEGHWVACHLALAKLKESGEE